MRYLPHTAEDIARMLRVIGAPSVDALFAHIPAASRARGALDLGPALDEPSLLEHLGALAEQNRAATARAARCFLGGGLIAHHIPTAVDAQLSRAEWYTSYTPYQPEISQGTLQAVFEFQTIVAELFDLDIANASIYDGASAAAEAVLMARRLLTGRRRTVLSGGLHPHYRSVVATYLSGLHDVGETEDVTEVALDPRTGRTDLQALTAQIDEATSAVVVQSPNYYGVVEDLGPLAAAAHARGALLVAVTTEPLAYGVLKPPGALGADIACGEGLGLGFAPTLGGPGIGLFASRAAHVRAVPGRLVGETVDKEGRRGYVLTLATREQHIRREKATSNICTNTGLMALAFTIHMCLLGRRGFRELALQNLAKAEYARRALSQLRGFSLRFSAPTFNELALTVRGGDAEALVERLAREELFAGVAVRSPGQDASSPKDTLLVALTERHRKEDIDHLAQALDGACP